MSAALPRLTTALADRYRVDRELGAGGMATVYLARDLKHGREVAIKVLHPDLGAALGPDRFLAEIRTTAQLQHPHILPLLDSGAADGLLYYVMPFVRGETLRSRLERERQLPIPDALRIAREVADALAYAHAQGVIHRDIKPENILLQAGHALVADFGIALAVEQSGGARMTQTGLSLGTPQYMSPEQAMGERTLDARTDVYALGAVTYEMLTGEPPFTGASVQAIVAKVITERPTPIRTVRDTVPEHIERAVSQALAKLPADRFSSAQEFMATCESFVHATEQRTIASPTTPSRFRVVALALTGAAATFAMVLGPYRAGRSNGSPASSAVEFTFKSAGSPLQNISGRTLALSPDGGTVAYATTDSTGVGRIFLRRMRDREQVTVPNSTDAMWPTFSPDGRRLAFVSGQQIRTIDVDGGNAASIGEVGPSGTSGLAWTADRIVATTRDLVLLYPTTGGKADTVMQSCFVPVALPEDGLVACQSRDSDIITFDVRSRKASRVGVQGHPIGVADGVLVFLRDDGTLMASDYNASTRTVSGTPRVAAENVQVGALIEPKAAMSFVGDLVYLSGDDNIEAVLVDSLGRAQGLPLPTGRFANPRIAADGRRVLLDQRTAGQQHVYAYDLASGAGQRLTTRATHNHRAEWAGDGRHVYYLSGSVQPTKDVVEQLLGGEGTPTVLLHPKPDSTIWQFVVSPDRKFIIYRTGRAGAKSHLWIKALHGDSSARQLSRGDVPAEAPVLSPDGRWVAYQSLEARRYEVFARRLDGVGEQVTISVGGGRTPRWSHDGSRIYFVNGRRMVEARVRSGESLEVLSRRVLFEGDWYLNQNHASYDALPSGRGLLMLRATSGLGEEIVVVRGITKRIEREP